MLVDLAEARHGGEIGPMHTLPHLARIFARRPHPCDAPTFDDDLLVVPPGPGVDVEQPADAQGSVRRALAQRRQHEVLADAHLAGGVDQEVFGKLVVRRHRASLRVAVRSGPHAKSAPAAPEANR